jgi:arylsulfate sulfotransferase
LTRQVSLFSLVPTTLALLSVGCNINSRNSAFEGPLPNPLINSPVTGTSNPQVAAYTVILKQPGTVTVDFGKDTTYGFETSAQHFAVTETPVIIYVAGMLASTTYHMRATIAYDNGVTVSDPDHMFTTGATPPGIIPSFSVTPTNGLTPQPGVELVNVLLGGAPIPFATDLNGNVIWTYLFPDRQSDSILYPIKLLPNGHFFCLIAPAPQISLTNGPVAATELNVLREIDLAGNTIRQLAMTDLNTSLAAAGYNISLQLFSHDFAVLPNGHILVIANTLKPYTNLTGYPGTTNVLGDVVIDLDQNFKPVWVWNEFDHLDVNRHPMGFPDWTHSNAIVYSPDDGNFLISIRHQNWIIKVNYNNAAGAGDILWKLGYQGDFTLQGAVDPTDWFYAQHDVNFISSNTTGNFKIAIMDNGDDRVFPTGVTCNSAGAPACLYSTVPIMQVDENAKTASFLFHQIIPANLYSLFAGDTRVLANGNVEYNLAGVGSDAYVFEVTPTNTPQTVWQMHVTKENTYRVFRMPSLYPDVQW